MNLREFWFLFGYCIGFFCVQALFFPEFTLEKKHSSGFVHEDHSLWSRIESCDRENTCRCLLRSDLSSCSDCRRRNVCCNGVFTRAAVQRFYYFVTDSCYDFAVFCRRTADFGPASVDSRSATVPLAFVNYNSS